MDVILGIDHGTTRTKVLALDHALRIVAEGAAELPHHYPQPGWVEQSPEDILETTRAAIAACLAALPPGTKIAGLGLANQGETVLVWDRETGQPVYPAIVWQDRRTANRCAELAAAGYERLVHERTGLYLDPYFSATKVWWILTHVPDAQRLARAGRLLVGTTDTWILWNLSARRLFLTDTTTASRTSLLNLRTLAWDAELLDLFEIPRSMLPDIAASTGVVGAVELPGWPEPVPVAGLAVDQQAALFSHACLEPGMVKATYGTGTFVLMQIGLEPRLSQHGLVTTVAWTIDGQASYALDGGIYTTGAAVQWLVEGLRILDRPEQSAEVARAVPDSDDVYVVPAFSGLAAPYWDPRARGLIIGLTLGTSWAHVVRATLEGIAYRVRDVVEAMEADAGVPLQVLRVDGGPTRNPFLMQFQADVLGVPVEVAETTEATARGAALLAGLGLGWWTTGDVAASWRLAARYEPAMSEEERERRYARWRRAVERAREWAE